MTMAVKWNENVTFYTKGSEIGIEIIHSVVEEDKTNEN